MDADEVRAQVASELKQAIADERVTVDDAVTLVAHGMQLMDRYETMSGSDKAHNLLLILEEIAKGPDGEWGTDDDLLSPMVWNGVKTLIETGILQAIVKVIAQIRKGTFPSINDQDVQQCATGCIGLIVNTILSPQGTPKSSPRGTPK